MLSPAPIGTGQRAIVRRFAMGVLFKAAAAFNGRDSGGR